jgi:large subunit ribosomal protein L23
MRSPEKIIKRPLLTEKGTRLKETGGRPEEDVNEAEPESLSPQVAFEVAGDANKIEIRHAVEQLWKVTVVKVRTTIVRGKEKRLGRFVGRRSNWKKAIVTLAAGQNIDFFEGGA